MMATPRLSEMLAWRRLLETHNPNLLTAVREQWDGWLREQRTQPPEVSKAQLVIIADLTCIEDIAAHVALAQLLALRTVRCSVVLSFSTAAMMRIARAQAWRTHLQGLVQVVDGETRRQLLDRLPADVPLAVFSGPAILEPKCMAAMVAGRHDWRLLPERNKDGSPYRAFLLGSGFIGRAGDYPNWKAQREAEGTPWSDVPLSSLSAGELGLSGSRSAGLPRNAWPKADAAIEAGRRGEAVIDVSSLDRGDELILRTLREPLPSAVIERRSAKLCPPDEPLELRLPASLLTTAPRIARLESHKVNGQVAGTSLLLRVMPTQLQPWMVSAFLNRGGGGNPVVRAFAEGLGCRLAYAEDEPASLSEIPVVWGVLRDSDRILAQAKAQSLYFFYIDHAYFDRGHGKSYRITRNRYEAGAIRKCPADRLEQLGIEVEPWRKSGREIIVCPPTDYFIAAHGCADWLDSTLGALRSATDRPITIREKPQPGEAAVPLKKALKTAHALVTHSSNVAIEAACLGIPVFVSPASAAAPVGQTDLLKIETPVYPDRQPWLAHLAYNQFSLDEIRTGEAWRLLLELEEREFA